MKQYLTFEKYVDVIFIFVIVNVVIKMYNPLDKILSQYGVEPQIKFVCMTNTFA